MLRKAISLFKNEDGAVTVDFVVLTGIIVLLAVAAFAPVNTAIGAASDDLAETIVENTTN